MSGPVQALTDVLFFLALAIVAVGLGRQLLSWLRVEQTDWLEATAMGGPLGLAVLAYVVAAMGAAGLLYASAGWALLGAAAAISARQIAATAREWVNEARAGSRWSPVAGLLWSVVGLGLVLGLVRSLAPPTASDWDSLHYHLAFPAIYLRHHRLVQVPFSSHSYFPFTMEMLYTLGLLVKGVGAAKSFHLLTACFTLAAMTAWGRRLNVRLLGPAAAVVYFGTPTVYSEMGTGYVDLGITCYALAALYALSRWQSSAPGRWHLVAGAFAGVCVGMKYTGVLALALVALVSLAGPLRRESHFWRKWVALCALAAAIGAPWYVKNQIQTGNPVYPFAYGVFGGVRWSQELTDAYSQEQKTYGTGRGPVDLIAAPWNLTMWPWNHDPARGLRYEVQPVSTSTVGPLYLALLAPFLVLRPKPPDARLWGLAGGFYFLAWFFMMQYVRYLFPCLAFLALCVGWVLCEAWRRFPRAGVAAVGAMVAFLAPACWLNVSQTAGSWGVLAGRETAHEYLARTLDMYRAARFANDWLPTGAKILTYGEPRGFYLEREYLWGDPQHSLFLDYSEVNDCDSLARLYAEHGVTHVLINGRYFKHDYLLSEADLRAPSVLASRLRLGDDRLSHHLRDQLSAETQEALAAWDGSAPLPGWLLRALLRDLNAAMAAESFAEVLGSNQTESSFPEDRDALTRRNRGLLEKTYPEQIAPLAPLPRLVLRAAETGLLQEVYRDRKMRLLRVATE